MPSAGLEVCSSLRAAKHSVYIFRYRSGAWSSGVFEYPPLRGAWESDPDSISRREQLRRLNTLNSPRLLVPTTGVATNSPKQCASNLWVLDDLG